MPEKSLYQRLGGYDAIVAIVDDLLPRLMTDAQLSVYWKGKSNDGLKKERQLLIDFLGMAFGGPVSYCGRDMKTSHDGLGITDAEWDTFARHTVAALDNQRVPDREKQEFLAAAGSLKAEVVGPPRVVKVAAARID